MRRVHADDWPVAADLSCAYKKWQDYFNQPDSDRSPGNFPILTGVT